MKVLMLGWELPPHHSGGLGVACYEMCKEITTHGVDIEFVLPYTAKHSIDFMKITPAHHQSVEKVKLAGGAYTPEFFGHDKVTVHSEQLDLRRQHDLFAQNVAKLVETMEFDIIHAHDWLTFRAGLLAKRATGKPLVAHVHATQYDQSGGGYGNPEAREIEQSCLMEADQIFAVSQLTKDVLVREYGIPSDKISVVHNSMEVHEVVDEDQSVYRYLDVMKSQGYKVVVNIGRKTLQKGLTHLLEAAQKVVAKNPKILFLLAGSGEQERELIELAAYYGISKNVIFVGWVSGKPWRDSYRIGDVFIMPSVSEPFGLVALEAIGYGCPVIISKQSGVAEVLRNCLKADFWDTDKLADLVLQVCEHDSLRNELWRNSFIEYQNQSWRKSAEIMKTQYRQLKEKAPLYGR